MFALPLDVENLAISEGRLSGILSEEGPRYIALLKNGFDRPPAELLRQCLDLDLSAPCLLNDDFDLLGRKLDQIDAIASGK